MADTSVQLRKLNADEQVRQEAFYRKKRLHDEASALGSARREGREEGRVEGRVEERNALADKWRKKGFTEEQIRDLLGD